MTRALILATTLLSGCAAPATTRLVCGTNADGWVWCVTLQERQP